MSPNVHAGLRNGHRWVHELGHLLWVRATEGDEVIDHGRSVGESIRRSFPPFRLDLTEDRGDELTRLLGVEGAGCSPAGEDPGKFGIVVPAGRGGEEQSTGLERLLRLLDRLSRTGQEVEAVDRRDGVEGATGEREMVQVASDQLRWSVSRRGEVEGHTADPACSEQVPDRCGPGPELGEEPDALGGQPGGKGRLEWLTDEIVGDEPAPCLSDPLVWKLVRSRFFGHQNAPHCQSDGVLPRSLPDRRGGADLTSTVVKAPFDRIASRYDETRGWTSRGQTHAALIAAHLDTEGPFVELGVGTGVVAEAMGTEVGGVDLSAGMLAQAAERIAGRLAQADLVRLPFSSNCFGGAYAAWVMDFVTDQRAALHEVGRVLRRAARFVVIPAPKYLWPDDDPIQAIVGPLFDELDNPSGSFRAIPVHDI
jgi:hypothetical protein